MLATRTTILVLVGLAMTGAGMIPVGDEATDGGWMRTARADHDGSGEDPVCAAIDPWTGTVSVQPEHCTP